MELLNQYMPIIWPSLIAMVITRLIGRWLKYNPVYIVVRPFTKESAKATRIDAIETAQILMEEQRRPGVRLGVQNIRESGLMGYYQPIDGSLMLDDSLINNCTIESMWIAAHEMGHVMQSREYIKLWLAFELLIDFSWLSLYFLIKTHNTVTLTIVVLLYVGYKIFTLCRNARNEYDANQKAFKFLTASPTLRAKAYIDDKYKEDLLKVLNSRTDAREYIAHNILPCTTYILGLIVWLNMVVPITDLVLRNMG